MKWSEQVGFALRQPLSARKKNLGQIRTRPALAITDQFKTTRWTILQLLLATIVSNYCNIDE